MFLNPITTSAFLIDGKNILLAYVWYFDSFYAYFLKLSLHMPFYNICSNVLINCEVFIQIKSKADMFKFPQIYFLCKTWHHSVYHQTPVVLNVFFSPFNDILLNSR